MDGCSELSGDLERETAALRRIARGILLEPALAEDAVQEAWLAALRTRGHEARSGGWMNEAVRRIALGLRRSEARRSVRERAAASPEHQPSAADTAARVELLRELLEALKALEEPYRTAVELRLVDDLPPRAIAARTGVPVETARTRVKRGVERLRARLDAKHADRRGEFLAALAPLAGIDGWSVAASALGGSKAIGGILMSANAKLAAAAVLAAVAGLWWMQPWSPSAPRAEVPAETLTGSEVAAAPSTSRATDADSAAPIAAERLLDDARRAVGSAAAGESWVLRGRAFRGRDEPFPLAQVSLRVVSGYDGDGAMLHDELVTAGSDGTFALALQPPTTAVRVRVLTNEPGYLGSFAEQLVVRGAPAPTNLRALCYPLDVTVRGTVLDLAGAPIGGAHVDGRGSAAETDASGRFEVAATSLLRDESLSAWAPGFAERSVAVQTEKPGIVDGIKIRLSPSAVLRGRVVDADGHPVAQARVESYQAAHARATSGDDGRFTLDCLPRNERWISVSVEADGFARLRRNFEDGRVPADEVVFELQRGLEIRGRVVDERNAPLPGAQVFTGSFGFDAEALRAVAGDDGRFVLQQVPREVTEYGASADGFAAHNGQIALPQVGPFVGELAIVLSRGCTAAGVVVDERDEPLADVLVSLRDARTYVYGVASKTDADGRFELTGVPARPHLALELYAEGFVRLEAPIDPTSGIEQRIVMTRAAGLAGRVVDAASGAPVTAFRVRFVSAELHDGEEPLSGFSSTWWVEGREIRDERGAWNTAGENLAAGEVTGIEITAAGYGPAIVARAVTALDFEASPIVVQLGSGARVAGRVVDARDGRPLAGAAVRRFTARDPVGPWNSRGEHARLEATTDERGEFALEGLPVEPMSLFVEVAGFAPAFDGPFELGSSAPPRHIELALGAILRGVLRDADGRALPGEPIRVSIAGDDYQRFRSWDLETDGDGRFELRDLAPGTYTASHKLRHENAVVNDLARGVDVTEARVYDIELRPLGKCRLVGTVRAAGNMPPTMTMSAIPDQRASPARVWRSALVRNGRFELEGLEAGHWQITVDEPGFWKTARSGSAEVDVVEGGANVVLVELVER